MATPAIRPANRAANRAAKSGTSPKADGRTLRSANTRRAVAEAYLNLLDGGDLRPTARAIASEAGVSGRAVFRHFQDMETLHSEAAVLQIQRVAQDLPAAAPTTGPLETRAALLAERWCALNERVTPVRRVALLHEPFSDEIARRLKWAHRLARAEIKQTFAGEITPYGSPTRNAELAALSAVLSWETWNEMRRRQQLKSSVAIRTITVMLQAVLARFPLTDCAEQAPSEPE